MSFASLIPGAQISSSGLYAERVRMETVANNLANVNSTGGDDGGVYRRRVAVFDASFKDQFGEGVNDLNGVKVNEVALDDRDPVEKYAPYHPLADENGMVAMPNISPIEEMLDMITATRAYEANLSIMNESKKMADKTINMFR